MAAAAENVLQCRAKKTGLDGGLDQGKLAGGWCGGRQGPQLGLEHGELEVQLG